MFKRKAKEKKIKKPRFQVFRDAYKVTKQVKPWIPFVLAAIFIGTWAVGIGIGAFFGSRDECGLKLCSNLAVVIGSNSTSTLPPIRLILIFLNKFFFF